MRPVSTFGRLGEIARKGQACVRAGDAVAQCGLPVAVSDQVQSAINQRIADLLSEAASIADCAAVNAQSQLAESQGWQQV